MTVIVSVKHKKLLVPTALQVANRWGVNTKVVSQNGTDYEVYPHTPAYVIALRNMGVRAPGLMDYHYDWPGGQQPFHAQRVTADALSLHKRMYVLNEIGTGKTRSALFAADFLMRAGAIRKCLVAAPLSTISPVWESEIMRIMPHRESISLHHASKAGRLKRLSADVDFYIINHHGIGVLLDDLKKFKGLDCVIIDELAIYRNVSTNLWKTMNALVGKVPYVWGMTGSPMPNDPMDAFGQIRLITPERAPRSKRAWHAMTMNKITQFISVAKPDAHDTVYKAMRPSVRFSRDDCFDLPPLMVSRMDVPLAKRQESIYNELSKRFRAQLMEGEVTAANEGVLLNKLLQVSCGFVYTNTKGEVDLHSTARLDALKNIIEAANHKVIVYVPFVFAVNMLAKEVSKYASCEIVHGGIPKRQRDDIFTRFQSGDALRVLVAQPACMARGLTLTASNVIVWYGPTTSAETYEQANGRITRSGQTNKQYIIHIANTPVERKVYARVERKQKTQGLLLDMFKGVEDAA